MTNGLPLETYDAPSLQDLVIFASILVLMVAIPAHKVTTLETELSRLVTLTTFIW
jgi:hypothetical protein